MATKTRKSKAARRSSSQSRVTVDRGEKAEKKDSSSSENFLDKIQTDLEKNQSYLNLVLGALIVIVLGVLVYNYFNKPTEQPGDLGPAQQMTDESGDVTIEGLPGKYTVKEGDTLFLIAQKYYNDGEKYEEIKSENNLTADSIEVGQELTIPRIETMADASASPEASDAAMAQASIEPSPSASPSPEAMAEASPAPVESGTDFGKGGAENQTIWGESITGDSYTVAEGDWLSKISGRAYNGDIMMYNAIAQANNITDPNRIEVGTVLKIPRK